MRKTKDDTRRSLQRMVSLLAESPGLTASAVGNALWSKREQGDLVPARFARPAGRLLSRGRKLGLVYCCLNVDVGRHVWYARKQANDPSSATRPTGRTDCNSDAMAGFAAAHG